VHGTEILQVKQAEPWKGMADDLEGMDALITDVTGVCIGVSTADCIPVLLYDEVHHAAAAIHAGWRGTVKRIAAKAVESMRDSFGTHPEELKAVIGPGISLDAFEVGDEVYDQFQEEGFPIEILRSRSFVTGEDLAVKDKGKRDMPYKNIVELINEKGHNAKIISPFAGEYKGKLKISKIASICSDFMKNGGDFAYVYWPDPDATLHSYGVKNHHVQKVIRKCRRQVDKFSKKNKDVLVLVIADHGMVDVQYRDLAQYPDIDNCLDCTPFLDSRCPSFKLKPGKEEEFKKAFLKHFSFEATLYTKEEILSSSYFGIGEPNPKNADRLGDYVALIDGPDCFFSSTYPCNIRILKGHHAGMDERERRIIVAAFNK
jgi:hypothetical protein